MRRKTLVLLLTTLAALLAASLPAAGQTAPPGQAPAGPAPAAQEPLSDPGWPRDIPAGEVTLRLFQPQLEAWTDTLLKARAAVGVIPAGTQDPAHYGVIWFTARTEVDKVNRLVDLDNLNLVKADFPTQPSQAGAYGAALQKGLSRQDRVISLDRLEAALAASESAPPVETHAVRNDPPRVYFSMTPALLVLVDGEPVLRPMEGTGLQRVINTRVLLANDPKDGVYYLRIMDGWMSAKTLDGGWAPVKKAPRSLAKALAAATAAGQVDVLEGQPLEGDSGEKMTLELAARSGKVPAILVSLVPAELIQTQGTPQTEAIPGTGLLWVTNTGSNLFTDPATSHYYVLLSGRWFRSTALAGPWEFVAGSQLPAGFARIPLDHAKSGVLASIPGTGPAKEALIANSIPQTATITRSAAKLEVKYDGDPKFKDIEGTNLKYAVNARTPVIRVSPDAFYALENAVWFTASVPKGPWAVATSVPAAIYAIPVNSPLHYVTYVRIYGYTDTVVYVGYTPGYYGTVVTPEKVVVYGSGWYYPPYVGAWWYGWPCTYGYGATFVWTSGCGWAIGFGVGYGWGWYHPYWGPWWGWYGPWYPAWGWGAWGGFAAVNVYGRWGDVAFHGTRAAWANPWTGNIGSSARYRGYNPSTGTYSRAGRISDTNVYTGNWVNAKGGAAYNPETGRVIAGGKIEGGNIYSGDHGSAGGAVIYDRDTHNGAAIGKNDIYASKDGDVYHYDRDTKTWSKRDDGSWEPVDPPDGGRQPKDGATTGDGRDRHDRDVPAAKADGQDRRTSDAAREPASARHRDRGATRDLDRDYEARSKGEFRSRRFDADSGGWRSRRGGGGGGGRIRRR
ncbi:MAG: hypothetical protein KA419_15180 [Acidobacteria bacterium]|nr:hypothetical protein [Acidobacteriota bacterium]